jgi:hypothetical protein
MEYKETEHLYPILPPTAPPSTNRGGAYRLQKISEIQQSLQTERDKRGVLSKKYHRTIKIINACDDALVTMSVGLGLAGIGLLTTIVASPAVLVMEVTALGSGLFSIIGSVVNRKLTARAEKHEKIKVLAEAKLNTISDHISKALKDDMVSDDEYALILSELEKFDQMKSAIRNKTRATLDEETKQSYIIEGREQAMNTVKKMLEKKHI